MLCECSLVNKILLGVRLLACKNGALHTQLCILTCEVHREEMYTK